MSELPAILILAITATGSTIKKRFSNGFKKDAKIFLRIWDISGFLRAPFGRRSLFSVFASYFCIYLSLDALEAS
jgi:hypothetical protein